jgi:hypothetical protein
VAPIINLTAETTNENNTNEINRNDTPIIADFSNIDSNLQQHEDNELSDMSPTTEKLYWHYKLGHLPFSVINRMAMTGLLPKRLATTKDPKCAACLFGQSTKRPWRSKAKPNSINHITPITKSGDCVSVDQMVSPVPGLVAQTKGYPTKMRYNAATIFVDQYSDLTYCHLQPTLNADDTIEAKEAFERFCNSHGVKIKHYHANNGRFAETAFMAHVAAKGQTISFCGVNAHFQNGKAERRIRTLQDLARTQLLHAIRKWPIAITAHLWPYAVTNVTNVLNDTPTKNETKTRLEIFANTPVSPNIKHHHHIGVPAYVLTDELQAGKKIPKWLPRARVGIYLGKSPRHARNVSLVLNPRTGMTSAQYHVRFDDTFDTVSSLREDSHGWWLQKCGFTTGNAKINTQLDFTAENIKTTNDIDKNSEIGRNNTAIHSTPVPDIDVSVPITIDPLDLVPDIGENEGATVPEHEGDNQAPQATEQPATRRSQRTWKPTARVLESLQQQDMALPMCMQAAVYDTEYQTIIDDINPITLLAQTDADTMYWDQALKQPDAEQFIEAAIKEVSTHQQNGHWRVIPREDVPKENKVLDSVWSMKRKRRVKTNEVYKHKARLNVHGGQQELGVNY